MWILRYRHPAVQGRLNPVSCALPDQCASTGQSGVDYNSTSGTIFGPLAHILSANYEQATQARVCAHVAGSEVVFGASPDKLRQTIQENRR